MPVVLKARDPKVVGLVVVGTLIGSGSKLPLTDRKQNQLFRLDCITSKDTRQNKRLLKRPTIFLEMHAYI